MRINQAGGRRSIKTNARLIGVLTAAVCCGGVSRVMADTWTWNGGGDDGFWSDASNWTHTSGSSGSGTPLSSDNTVVDFAGSATNPQPNQNIASPLTLNSLGFNSGAGPFDLIGDGLTFANNSGGTAPTIVVNSNSVQQTVETLTLANTTTISGTGTGEIGFFAPILGTGGLVVSAAAPVFLEATNTYSGGTTINGGQVEIGSNQALGSGTLTFSGGTLTAFGNALVQNAFTAGDTTITLQADTGNTLTFNPSSGLFGSLNFGGSGQTGLINFEPATFSYFGGNIDVNSGTLLDGADALSQILSSYSVSIASGATFNINGFSTTIKDLTGSGSLVTGTNASETFTLQAANFSGNITGSGKLIVGGGTVILSGTNTYSGGTNLNGGLLSIASGDGVPSGAISVTGSTSISAGGAARSLSNAIAISSGQNLSVVNDPTGAESLTLSGNISGSGALATSGSVNLTLDGTNSYSGGTTLNGGQININNNSSLGNASGTLTLNGGTLASTSNVTENNT
ncbi:MAG TPA: autotransporter-associated beta strand repeat-containing protein, partial [Tepidisphaeraceae bacterium]|nr:autotransporter-associated beta strand repeat-containing protein [Tepidisphaeraceae bacterium]